MRAPTLRDVAEAAAVHVATASGVNQTVRLPRARRPASYSAQLVTRWRCLGMRCRRAALVLNGTVEIRDQEGTAFL